MTRTALTDAFPKTAALAVAAALSLSACSTYGGGDDLEFGTRLAADLEGENEVPQEGDPNGAGGFEAALGADGEMCYELVASGIAPAAAAHIHRGAAGENGPPVVSLIAPKTGEAGEACTMIETALAQEILADPETFYVNVHNEPYPGGAIRGQLVAPQT